MKAGTRLFLFFVGVGLVLWVADAAMDALYIYPSFAYSLTAGPHELYGRSVVTLAVVGLGAVVSRQVAGLRRHVQTRHESEAAIRRERDRAEQYLNIAEIMLATIDADEKITLINKKGREILGYAQGELIGENWFDTLVSLRARDEVRGVFQELMAGRTAPVEYYENPLLRKDGEERIFSFHNTVIRDRRGQITGVLLSARDITDSRRAEEALRQSHEQMRHLAAELVRTEQRERRRLAAHLHDTVGQTLTTAKIILQDLTRRAAAEPDLAEEFRKAQVLIGEASERVRSAVFDLSPPILHEVGLEGALESLARRIKDRHGLDVTLEEEKGPVPLSEETRVVLYRAVRELLHNVVRHADATRAAVAVRRGEGRVRIVVEDDGVGFDPEAALGRVGLAAGFGLVDIRERLDYLDGSADICSRPHCGTRVTLTAPLAPAE